ncbi:type II toxin-antitoxin system HicA family toxin [Methylobacter sp.]|uniref:type II toxin-antitoxin system HicA family toxin n=1 Tax=Methylobacter sp. TaxID=2051955 RepID=UPI002487954B|nr:type II toxin-antitoxin system HicA family toxin [Methylobacter sp.]MDI1276762.1 type II toxin-antitoxin system HicA family toxin [Methylobacter sp.]MDI1357430.1 type II toxin-antitoxin system HicA family toxin [Methylobacter sp.]
MRLPRDIHGIKLAKALVELGYHITRQTGSHIRQATFENGEHDITIPAHNPLKIGTLAVIFSDIESHFKFTRDELLKRLRCETGVE